MQTDALFALDRVTLRPARLREVSLEIPRGVTAVLGWSGAGKTSLLNLLAGFEKPDAGKLHGDTRVAWAPQEGGLWPDCTAREHLTECGASASEADRLLAAFDLAHRAAVKPTKLSRGEQSRLAIARALAMPLRTLVFDEPLAHVDPARTGKYWRVIREHLARTSAPLIFATHSPEVALAEAQHAIGLREGAVIFSGSLASLYDEPATEELATLLGPTNWLSPDEAQSWFGGIGLAAASVRPERLHLEPADDGAVVVASRFCGAHTETELRLPGGATRVFLHRPPGALECGARVRLEIHHPHRT